MAESSTHSPARGTGSWLVAVGTYTRPMPHVHGIGRGIHLLRFDAGTATLRELQVDSHGVNPSYLCHSASLDLLYGVSEQEVGASIDVYAVDDAATLRHLLNVPTPGASPCHISLTPAADRLFVSNYGSGELLSYRLDGQGLPSAPPDIIVRHGSGPRSDRQASPHVHCAQPTPSGDAVYLCDLGTDSVARHALRGAALDLLPDLQVQIGPGSGPRHLRLNPAGTRAFVLNELSNSVSVVQLPTARDPHAHALARIGTLPADWQNANSASALCLHPSGRWLYATNRGHDSIAGFRLLESAPWLEPIGLWPAGGRTPRDAAITPDGGFLLVASQDEHRISCLRIDPDSGQLQPAGVPFAISSPACVLPLLRKGTPRP